MEGPAAKPARDWAFSIAVRGPFYVRTATGKDKTPDNQKERAILAILALAPERRQSRAALQARLWSESPPEKASANLRRALSNLRKRYGEGSELFMAGRSEVALAPNVFVDFKPELVLQSELLELVAARDPAFEDWLRDLRQADHHGAKPKIIEPLQPFSSASTGGKTIIIIRTATKQDTADGDFFETLMIDVLSARLQAEGADEIYAGVEPDPERLNRATTIVHFEMRSVLDAGYWSVHLRALADHERRFLWSGRLQLPFDANRLASGLDAQAFASRALSQILLRFHAFRQVNQSPLMIMQRAAARLYHPEKELFLRAEEELERLSTGEAAAVALGWRAFAKIARRIEFSETEASEAAEGLINEGLAKRPGNALVAALASRVALDVSGDLDRSAHFARAALESDSGNPYALKAMSRALLMDGKASEAHRHALMARRVADGLPHVYAWDCEVGLTALAEGDYRAAYEAMREAHRHKPTHRASLRYLAATAILIGEKEAAKQATARLARLEPGFRISDLGRPDYPVATLRRLGLAGEMPGAEPGT